jgi:hypothetical protein
VTYRVTMNRAGIRAKLVLPGNDELH